MNCIVSFCAVLCLACVYYDCGIWHLFCLFVCLLFCLCIVFVLIFDFTSYWQVSCPTVVKQKLRPTKLYTWYIYVYMYVCMYVCMYINSYTSANLFNSLCPKANRPPINGYSSRGNSNACHYTVPISNRYAVLSKLSDSHQTYGTLPSLNLEQPTGFLPRMNINYNKRHHWKKIPSIKHSRL